MKKILGNIGIFVIIILAISIIVKLSDSSEETSALGIEKKETASEARQNTIKAFNSGDFMNFVDSFYALEDAERSEVYSSTIEGSVVNWTGIITDLDTISDSIIVLGKPDDAFVGGDWNTLNNDFKELLPYIIAVEMTDPSVKSTLSVGQSVKFTGEIGARGDIEMNYNWKLYKGEVFE